MRSLLQWFRNLLFYQHPATFESDYDLDESVHRLSAIVRGWPYLSFKQGLAGKVRPDRVRIRRAMPFVHNSFIPVFFGAFRADSGKVRLEGYFAMELFTRAFLILWFGLLLVIGSISLFAGIFGTVTPSPGQTPQQARLMAIFFPFFIGAMAVGGIILGKWLGRNDETFITERIRGVLQKPSDEIPNPWGERAHF